ncbi:hypothetical protein BDV98DRAFT_596313 [Pterulicium gracile]|uniref:Uncharacterized protein n=1 Tax=Pterulicium gracile TaxID=1884261 RepID=A0A5C3QBK9_9AGAR|nr:hypothetical protein BDV98DRAFT_596313 [Pterula gracilis]
MATATLNSTLEFPQYSKQPTSNFSISLTNCASVCLNLADTRHSSSGAEWFGNHALYWLAQMPLIASLLYACADLPDSSILLLRLKHLEAQNVGRYDFFKDSIVPSSATLAMKLFTIAFTAVSLAYIDELWAKPYAFSASIRDVWFARASNRGPSNWMCLDLTDGSKANRNMLQMWECAPYPQPTYKNQIWTLTVL